MTQPEPGGCGGKCGCSHRSDAPAGAPGGALPADEPSAGSASFSLAPPVSPPAAVRAQRSKNTSLQACGWGNHHAGPRTATAPGTIVSTMRVVETPSGASPAPHKCACKKLRPYRRIHSLFGLIFAAFLAMHLGVAATAVSPARFEANATVLQTLTDRFPALELIGVGIPLLIVLALGIHLLVEAGLNPARKRCKRCKRGGRVRYFLQRISAAVILAFVAFHLATLSRWGIHGGSYDPNHPFISVAAARGNMAVEALYFLAIVAVSYHLANGLWTGAIAWGVLESDGAKRKWEAVCAAFGVVLCSTGSVALYAFLHAARSV